jgi:hypothetical protein
MDYPSLRIHGVTVAQFPNPPLIVALVAVVVSWIAGEGPVYDVARAVFYVALTAWAWEEATRGVNLFRQVLGAAGLTYVVVNVAGLVS